MSVPEDRIRSLFVAVAGLAEEERVRLLRAPEVTEADRQAVLELLAFDCGEQTDAQLLEPIVEARRLAVSGRFGAYEIQQQIGRGGMGTVFKAQRADGEMTQIAALKVLDYEFVDPKAIERFRRERQILSGLAHPNIARLLDAGTREDGRPYLVMEYIEGEPLDRYVLHHELTIPQRLRLFLPICTAVEYAHSKLVIHRDLKPSNILVTADGEPKLLDFGIASALDAGTGSVTNSLLLTPQFACPDQARGDAPSTAVDVYGLGAVLYFLLTGHPPHQVEGLSPMEVVKYLSEMEPPSPAFVRPELRGDLDNVIRKALHLDPARRYRSASELSADIQRYLSVRPVLATPDSVWYRTQRFVARRRRLVAAAAVAMSAIAIAAGYGWTASQRAVEEAAVASAVNEFLQNDLLSQAGTRSQTERGIRGDPNLKVRTVLDRAAQSVPSKFAHLPKVEASIRVVIANAYRDLGLDKEALTHYERARTLYQTLLGPSGRDTLRTSNLLGEAYFRLAKRKEAEAVYNEVLANSGRTREDQLAAASARRGLALVLSSGGKRREAIPALQQAIAGFSAMVGPEHESTLTASGELAILYGQTGNPEEAERLFQRNLDTRRRILGPRHPDTLISRSDLGLFYRSRGRLTEAEAHLKEALEGFQATLGADHPYALNALSNLAQTYTSLGRYSEAESLDQQVLGAERKLRGRDHPEALAAANNLAVVYQLNGRHAQAANLYEELLAAKRTTFGAEHPSTLLAMRNLGSAYREMGRLEESARLSEQALRITRSLMGIHLDTCAAINELARTRKRMRRHSEAERLFLESLAMRTKLFGSQHQHTLVALNDLAGLYQVMGRSAEAERLFQQTLAARRNTLGDSHPSTLNTMSDLAGLYRSQNRVREALLLAEKVTETRNKTLGPTHPATLRAGEELSALRRMQASR